MKIIALGDTHGRTIWKSIVEKEAFDKLVFIGDYFDTHEGISPTQQKRNFKDIIRYKETNKEKVILLFGNHDFHYLSAMGARYSGFNSYHAKDIEEMLSAALANDYLQMCFNYKQFIFVHAGITKTWCSNTLNNSYFDDGQKLAQTINSLFKSKPRLFGFSPGKWHDPYGDEVEQSPVWVRHSLFADRLDTFTQVVGHTTQDRLIPNAKITFIDTLGTSGEYLSIVDGEMQVNNAYDNPKSKFRY